MRVCACVKCMPADEVTMVTYTAYLIVILSTMCVTAAWPQHRTSQRANESQEYSDRIVWGDEDRRYMKTLSSPTNVPRSSSTKPNTRRPQRLQDGFVLDQPPQLRRNDQSGRVNPPADDVAATTRRQRQQHQQEDARQHRNMDQAAGGLDESRPRPNRTVATRAGSPGHQAARNQSRQQQAVGSSQGGGSGRGADNVGLRVGANEGRGLSEKRSDGSSTRVKMPNEGIVFPEASRNDQLQFVPRVEGERPRCAGSDGTFCTDTLTDYPLDYINSVLDQQEVVYRNFFFKDYIQEENNIAQRFDDTQDESPLCLSKTNVVFPKMAQNVDNNWFYIINLDMEGKQQGVRVETCGKPDGACSYLEHFPQGVQTSCKQKFIYRQMLAVTENGTFQADSFKFPSCCVCYATMGGVLSRMGVDSGKQTPTPTRRRRRTRADSSFSP